MQLRIVHTTGYEYDGAAKASYNEARLTPGTSAEQIVVHTRLDISPTPWAYSYRDYFGTQVTAFEINEPHESLRVTSIATVHTNRQTQAAPSLAWSELLSPDVADAQCEYLATDDLVAPPEELMLAVKEIAVRASRPGNAAREICALVHDEMTYRPGATDVLTRRPRRGSSAPASARTWPTSSSDRCVRSGIPARYVSGYLHPDKEPQAGVTVTGESHAWVEWWDAGWRGFDPTNDEPVGNRHVAIAAGRDYRDVRPLSGIYSGGVTSSMFVDVQITRLS
jgi:transglutaminase-like putative cysteine protease